MTDDTRLEAISGLLWEAAKAHHREYADVDGANGEWPEWYAAYLHPRIVELVDRPLTRSEVVYLLVLADRRFRVEQPDERWTDFYARVFLDPGV